MYKAENVDTNKALKYLFERRTYGAMEYVRKVKEAQAFRDGFECALDMAIEIFECSNYEKDAPETDNE